MGEEDKFKKSKRNAEKVESVNKTEDLIKFLKDNASLDGKMTKRAVINRLVADNTVNATFINSLINKLDRRIDSLKDSIE